MLEETVFPVTGILPARGSLMLDLVFLAMFAVVPLLGLSIYLAKQGKYQAHKTLQLVLGIVLLIAVTAFEIDMRFFTDWEALAKPSKYWSDAFPNPVKLTLWVHLCFAVPTFVLWVVVIVQALRKFASPPTPNAHSHFHKKVGYLAAGGMTMTAVTGWVFYYIAFVA